MREDMFSVRMEGGIQGEVRRIENVEVEMEQTRGTNSGKNGEKLAKDKGRQRGVLQTIGNVEQVRRTIGEHWFLEQGQRIMGYGTRHKGHIHSKPRGCGLGSGEAENGSPRWATWPESRGTHFQEKKQPHAHTLPQTNRITCI